MASPLLKKAFDPDHFKQQGLDTVHLLAEHLKKCLNQETDKVTKVVKPEEELRFWQEYRYDNVNDFHRTLLQRSIHLHHPHYIGHQVSSPLPIAAIESMVSALLNNGMAVYEMGQAASALEKLCIEMLCPYFGFDQNADGIFTSGGTLANLTALLCARSNYEEHNIWKEGTHAQYAFMVSEEAHYCIDRAVRIMGWGDEGVILIPSDQNHTMQTHLLEEYYNKASEKNIIVLGVVGSAPSTSTGMYDNVTALASFCKEHKLWFHLDAAHGGPAVFSQKYKDLMKGCELADSITVDGHKMMLMPALTTMLLFKEGKTSYHTFSQKAQYLFSQSDDEWYNYGKRTLECTKLMMSTRMYLAIKEYGFELFEQYVDTCYDKARSFAEFLSKHENFEVAVQPHSNIVCFRLINEQGDENMLNQRIRNAMLEDGNFYIVQTTLRGKIYLRITIMNPFTTMEDLHGLVERILSFR